MKRLFLLALLALFTLPIFAKHVDVEVARTVARSFWEQNLGKQTRGTFSDVTSQTEFTNFYIFNTSDGFVIVSADDIAVPILGYSDSGNFDPQNIPINMYEWLQGYEHDISLGISNGVSASVYIATDWRKLSSGQMASQKRSRSVNALVQTRWNQGSPYNNLCPYDLDEDARTVTGCVATAMAQIMKYWNYPTQGNGSQTYTHSRYGELSATFGNTTYDWSNMLNTYTTSATDAQKNAVATLMYHCGVAVEMSYGVSRTGGSGAVTVGPYNGTAEYAMENFFLYKNTLEGRFRSDYEDTDWKNMIIADLDASRPIIYTGRGDGGGHCFICDGYNNNNQFHFNWGWGGYCDGFYAINSMEPGTGGIGSGNGTYNDSQSAIFGIEPNAGLFAIPNALTLSGVGDSKTFMVRSSSASSQSWTATSSQSWLTLSPATGTGSGSNTTVTATAERNNTASERTATITITQGSATTMVTIVQPSGIPNDPGCFGPDGYDSFVILEPGNMVIECGEGFGYYTTGHQITKVKFTSLDGAATTNYTDYTNKSFTIKIYEGGSKESLSSGYSSNIVGAMGTQVYSQNFTQPDFGEQEVILNTPYTIDETKNFWVVLVANGKSLIREKWIEYGEPISRDNYEGSLAAYDGKYLYTDTYEGTDYLNVSTTAYYTDESCAYLQLYSIDFLLTFCTINPALLMVTPETLNFEATGETKNFTVKASDNESADWTAVSSDSWLTLSAYSGSGNGATTTVTATAAENISGADREATITITQGSETRVITVTQPDGSIADINRWYGNMAPNYMFILEEGNQAIIRPEKYGNFTAGSQVTKVRFETYNGARLQGYSDYVNTSFTIKIYENNSVNSALTSTPGYTSNINACIGTEVYSQNYTSESFAANDYDKTHIVELNTPYTIQDGVNFWIAVVVNGSTLFDYDRVSSGEPILSSEYNSSMAVARANGKYLYVDTYDGTDYLNMNNITYTDGDYKNTYSMNFDLSFYVSDGVTAYVPSSDFEAKIYGEDNYLIRNAVSIGATDNIVLYSTATNNGPDNAVQPFGITLKLGSETLDERTINLSESSPLSVGYRRGFSYTITAEQLNQMLATGTFDICFSIDYSGQDVNETNNTYCITVIRENPTFTISASVQPTAGGTVTGTGTYELGEGVNLVATPANGYLFTNWTESGTVVSTNANYQFTVTSDRTLVANFTQRTYNVTATVDPANSGIISGNNSPYTYGANVSLTANANAGYAFINWTDEDANVVSTNANYQFAIDGNRTFVAHFESEEYEITATANPSAGGSVTGAGTFQYGEQVTLTATANEGYNFVNWTENGTAVSTDAEYSFTATASRNLAANFQINSYTISASANPVAGGTINGAGDYTHGQTVTLTATASTGYNFVNWTENGTAVSTNATYSFTATANRTLVANFEAISYTITANANPTEGGSISGTGSYTYGQTTTLNATANTGYHFVNWTDGNAVVSSEATYSFTVSRNRNLIANFQLNTYTISASANPVAGGTVSGAGEYTHGQSVILNATANTGYNFVNWTENDAEVSTNAEYAFNATADRTLVANFEAITYTISASANPVEGGTINGTGDYTYGQNVTLNAVANTGYTFVNWIENGTEVSTNAEYTFTANSNRNLVANFQINTYTITVTANPAEYGTVNGGGNYTHGQTVTLNAIANTNYSFVNWTENGSIVSTAAEYSFTATENRTLVANFATITYTITANASPVAGGTVTGSGSYASGQEVNLSAIANTGYNFTNWTENGSVVSTNADYSFTAEADRTLVANFTLNTYTISAIANPTEGGTIEGADEYSHGETVTLRATANTGYTFTNWTEGNAVVSTDAQYSFSATADRTLVANFEINTYTVTAVADPTEGGTVTIDIPSQNGVYNYGTNLVITATANEGYHFVQWNDGLTTAQRTYMVDANAEFIAYFVQNEATRYIIAATANPREGGTITGTGVYEADAQAVLTATANTGYTFTNWTENGTVVSTNAEYSFTVITSRTLVANFELNTYTITASANPAEGGTMTGAGEYTHGQMVTLRATANAGYAFVNWTENGSVVSNTASYMFEATADRSLVANFDAVTYTINASANPADGGTISGTGNYAYGQNITLTAIANDGYIFANWTENGFVVSSDAEYSFTVTSDRTLIANFGVTTYSVTASANPTEGGTIDGAGDYVPGQTVYLIATANEGYTFVNWTENGSVVYTNPSYQFTAISDRTLVANFEINTYTIIASANPFAGGTIEGDGNYTYGQTATLTATANTGYEFVNWTEDNEIVSTDTEYSFTVTTNRRLVAHFGIGTYTISASANPAEGGTVEGADEYTYGQTATVRATANENYNFTNWTEDNEVVSTDAEYSFTVTADRNLVANFIYNEPAVYTITATANPTDGGTIEGAGVYREGETVSLSASARTGYHFVNWTENEAIVSTNAEYTFTARENRNLVANFQKDRYTVYITKNHLDGGTVEGDGEYEFGETATIIATANENYRFVNWTEAGEELSTEAEYSFEVTRDRYIVANFIYEMSVDAIELGSISAYPNPTSGMFKVEFGSITGDVTCQIVNASGSVIETRELNVTDGSEVVFDCNVAPGVYFVRVISNDKVWTESIVINR